MSTHGHTKSVYSPLYTKDAPADYPATPADPNGTPMAKQYAPETSLAISRAPRRYSEGTLRIAHNSLYALANKLCDPYQDAAHHARERLWAEILTRGAR